MRDIDLEKRIYEEKVCGVSAYDLRKAMQELILSGKYVPDIYKDLFKDLDGLNAFAIILDNAAFAAQCEIRRANGFETPEEE